MPEASSLTPSARQRNVSTAATEALAGNGYFCGLGATLRLVGHFEHAEPMAITDALHGLGTRCSEAKTVGIAVVATNAEDGGRALVWMFIAENLNAVVDETNPEGERPALLLRTIEFEALDADEPPPPAEKVEVEEEVEKEVSAEETKGKVEEKLEGMEKEVPSSGDS